MTVHSVLMDLETKQRDLADAWLKTALAFEAEKEAEIIKTIGEVSELTLWPSGDGLKFCFWNNHLQDDPLVSFDLDAVIEDMATGAPDTVAEGVFVAALRKIYDEYKAAYAKEVAEEE